MITREVLKARIADLQGGAEGLQTRIEALNLEMGARKLDLVATRGAISECQRLLESLGPESVLVSTSDGQDAMGNV